MHVCMCVSSPGRLKIRTLTSLMQDMVSHFIKLASSVVSWWRSRAKFVPVQYNIQRKKFVVWLGNCLSSPGRCGLHEVSRIQPSSMKLQYLLLALAHNPLQGSAREGGCLEGIIELKPSYRC